MSQHPETLFARLRKAPATHRLRRGFGFARLCAGLAALAFLLPAPLNGARAEVVLRAISALPISIDYTKSFLRFIDKVNTDGKGTVQIRFLGGPEVIPQSEQPDAVRRGVVDLQYGPASFITGIVPEGDALVGSRHTAPETRANGGLALLDSIYRRKLGVHLLGHFDSGVGFHIYLRKAPHRTPDGGIDLSGVKLRSQPIYREFFRRLGASVVSVPPAETFTALGRGVVDGAGWPLIGITDLSWDRHLKYRIDPPFFQTDLIALVNLRRWQSLPQAARDILEKVAIRHERESYAYFQAELPKIDAQVRANGMQVITLEGEAAEKYLDMANAVPWERLAKRDPTYYQALREKFYDK